MDKIHISTLGNPLSPSTWSGTPVKIANELIKKDLLGVAINSFYTQKYLLPRIGCRILNYLFFKESVDTGRGIINRSVNSIGLDLKLLTTQGKAVLHLGTLDLPLVTNFSRKRHYLFCDSTWNLWSSFSTQMDKYSENLLQQAEGLELKSYNQMTHIFTIGAYVKDNLVDHYNIDPEKISVVGSGLGGIIPFEGEKRYDNGKILFVAKDRFEDKGGVLLLQAMERLAVSNPNLKLFIVGQENYKTVSNLPNVEALGFVSKEVLQELFNECSLYVMPAINEPWGLVYLEAMACKMPIVGLNRNSFPEISGFGEYGFSVMEGTPDQLADTISKAFESPSRLKEMGTAAQNYCLSNFTWESTVNKIVDQIRLYD